MRKTKEIKKELMLIRDRAIEETKDCLDKYLFRSVEALVDGLKLIDYAIAFDDEINSVTECKIRNFVNYFNSLDYENGLPCQFPHICNELKITL